MTDEQIKELAQEYVNANWISESESYYERKRQIGIDDILPIFMWISQRYCIVPKKSVAEWVKDIEFFMPDKRSVTMLQIGAKSLFGKELFNGKEE